MHTFAHAVIVFVLLAVFVAGLALFWIARQDDSRTGRLVGILAMAASALILGWMAAGHRLF
jgi:hypothetical protein